MRRKIAIVEDDFLLALVMKKHLESEGYECHTFTNATDFFTFLKENPILNVIILDVKIKGEMNGIELFEKLSEISDIPVVFSTGNSEVKNLIKFKPDQIKGILIKPILLEELSSLIQNFN